MDVCPPRAGVLLPYACGHAFLPLTMHPPLMTYCVSAEEAVQRREKEKVQQDYLIDTLQENLKSLHQQLSLYSAQHEAQKRETRAARETLAEAEAEMEAVHFEKKQLIAQRESAMHAVARRNETLTSIGQQMQKQVQQEVALAAEIQGYKKDITKEQIKNETLTGLVKRLEAEAGYVVQEIIKTYSCTLNRWKELKTPVCLGLPACLPALSPAASLPACLPALSACLPASLSLCLHYHTTGT